MDNRDYIGDMKAYETTKNLLREMVDLEEVKGIDGKPFIIPDIIINKHAYILHHNEEGYLTGFEPVGDPAWEEHIFEIAKSRQRIV